MVWMAWKYVRTGDPVWRQASLFWTKVYGLVFASGSRRAWSRSSPSA
jgi:cytochrome bd-type quinol oxidase subunit 1